MSQQISVKLWNKNQLDSDKIKYCNTIVIQSTWKIHMLIIAFRCPKSYTAQDLKIKIK